MYSSPFLCKRKLTGLFAAHDTPACPCHSRTAGSAGIATHRETLSTATPKKARRRKSRQQGTVHSCIVQKSKGRQPAYTHRRPLSVQQQSFYKGDVTPPPPQRDHVRTEGFLYWLQYSRVTLLLHKNCHILTVQMS